MSIGRRRVAALMIVLAGIALFVLVSGGRRDSGLHRPTTDSRVGDSERSQLGEYPQASRNTRPAADVTQAKELSIAVLKRIDTRTIALSMEEAAWLDRHHYPTVQELAGLSELSVDDLLRGMRDDRDPKAAVLLGLRKAKDGDDSGALAALSVSTSRGSLYGREQLAIAVVERTAGRAGTLSADQRASIISGLEVAEMLGDHRAAPLINRYAIGLDRQAYADAIQLQKTEYLRQAKAEAESLGYPEPKQDLRPNAALWKQIDEAPASARMIRIYPRRPSHQ
ncbi:2-dehydro-3-deoxygalactonokinase [Lysobacter sp. cf310]|uniref:2-dehydro-3-deoxygalactonokinase n=1 Tax=Lysobacter sp. cf310 TaxID=1761790 RepID=UPI0011139B25|nr:2-dehydro-3-deoxygalactonokinase [Lysobacter sp. cf310]